MKFFAFLAMGFLLLPGCNQPKSDSSDLWKAPPRSVLTAGEAQAEITEKMERIHKFLADEKLEAVLLTQVRNVYWITAGIANNQIVLNKDVGAASLLITRDGKKYLVCNGSEAGRMMDESLAALGYELAQFNWYDANPVHDVRGDVLKSLVKGTIGSDVPYPGTVLVGDKFKRLRYSLTDGDIKRYRWVGRQVTDAVAAVCRKIAPGMDEFQLEAMTAAELRSRGILPTVLLTAVDDRIAKYRHALPGGAKLQKYAMINVVAERWGMPIAVTRFVHFGPLPADLAIKLGKVAQVMANYESATVPGAYCAAIFEQCKQWYAAAGYEGEWQKHHQGGATGYDDRDYVIYPGVMETVQDRQAFAWNPTITGAKVEDTFIAYKDHIEVVTTSDNWPMIPIDVNGKTYHQPGILIR